MFPHGVDQSILPLTHTRLGPLLFAVSRKFPSAFAGSDKFMLGPLSKLVTVTVCIPCRVEHIKVRRVGLKVSWS